MEKEFSSCGYLGSVLQKFCKTASIILRLRYCARANAQRIAAIAPAYAFTLAEIMIVLVVIGILTGILVPAAMNSMPNENIMKFKKAHNTLYRVINELVSSDKYYADGDLGIRADGTLLTRRKNQSKTDSSVIDNYTYFCKTFADLITTKYTDCTKMDDKRNGVLLTGQRIIDVTTGQKVSLVVTQEGINSAKDYMDSYCKSRAKTMKNEIVATDGVVYYELGAQPFGLDRITSNENNDIEGTIYGIRAFSPPNQFPANYSDQDGFDIAYKVFCIDVDGIPDDVTTTDCKNECPFGYGIRADGKILTGARADEWLEKSIQEKE